MNRPPRSELYFGDGALSDRLLHDARWMVMDQSVLSQTVMTRKKIWDEDIAALRRKGTEHFYVHLYNGNSAYFENLLGICVVVP